MDFCHHQAKDHPDPLSSAKLVAAWLRQLPSLDVIGRQEQVMRAFDGMLRSRKPIDLNRVAAIEYLDATLGPDRRQLIKQYVENVEGSPRLAERLWQAVQQLGQAFTAAYQACLDEALAEPGNARWAPVLPTILSRLIHYYGTDAKLRVFRLERWIPAKWMELHRLYNHAVITPADTALHPAPGFPSGIESATPCPPPPLPRSARSRSPASRPSTRSAASSCS